MRRGEQRRLGIGQSTVRSRWSRPATYLVFVAAGFVTLAAYAITGLLWLFGVVIILAGLVGVWLLWIYRRRRSLRPAWTWPVLVLCFVVGSVVSGLIYNDVPVVNLTLDPASGVPPGQYLELGRTSDTLYLLSCTDTQGGVIGIPSAAVLRAEYAPKPDWLARLRSLTDPRPLGLDTNCR